MVRRLASGPSTPAGQGGDEAAYVMIVVDTQIGEVDAYGPTTLAEAVSDMQVLRADLDADGAEFDGIAIRVLELVRRPAADTALAGSLGGRTGDAPQVPPLP